MEAIIRNRGKVSNQQEMSNDYKVAAPGRGPRPAAGTSDDKVTGAAETRGQSRPDSEDIMNALPKMPKMIVTRECACGCKGHTKSTWVSGHDGRAMGWATRVIKGVITLNEVPSNELAGCKIMIARLNAQAAERKVG